MLKYAVSFSIKDNKQDLPTPIRLRVTFNNIRLELYVSVSVKPSEWNGKSQRLLNRKDPRNKEISNSECLVEEIFKEFDVFNKRFPTSQELKLSFAKKSGKTKNNKTKDLTFVEVINKYIDEKKVSKQWTEGTLKKYIKLRNHVIGFNKSLLTNNMDEIAIRDMMKYFSTSPIDIRSGNKREPHRNTTIRRNIEDYLRILKWASKKGLYSGTTYEDFEQRFKGTQQKLAELVYLEWEELMDLLEKDFGVKKYLERVRDVFCFCCFSSLRYSDVSKLKKTDIRDGYFLIASEKTTDPLSIDLNKYSKAILDKYEDVELPNGLALPIISMAKTNEYLKEIGEIMEFNTPIKDHYFIGNKSYEEVYLKKNVLSTHAARRTFVINSLRLGIPVEVIIKWTGHKDFKALRPYVKIVDDLKRSEMDKFNITPSFTPRNK
ncbi:site-specific integrase [Chryseobacterium potabilaquae]|uniref:Core-binding (CB) domain-containing protein n=1 Tax=Chryseobacterium potabilaquae TaxID=2675057 RepID=A0A6N4XCU3_9FLAO|nr:site-specific integrase [Chryseobacterium potabilaquae]CAA7197503.1 hypothetical protein CHRY9293_03568 [Chryseobacterium potabilaquae]